MFATAECIAFNLTKTEYDSYLIRNHDFRRVTPFDKHLPLQIVITSQFLPPLDAKGMVSSSDNRLRVAFVNNITTPQMQVPSYHFIYPTINNLNTSLICWCGVCHLLQDNKLPLFLNEKKLRCYRGKTIADTCIRLLCADFSLGCDFVWISKRLKNTSDVIIHFSREYVYIKWVFMHPVSRLLANKFRHEIEIKRVERRTSSWMNYVVCE